MPLLKLDYRHLRCVCAVVGNRRNGRNQAFVPFRILREALHNIAVGLAISELEHVLTGISTGELNWNSVLLFDASAITGFVMKKLNANEAPRYSAFNLPFILISPSLFN